MDYKMLNFFLSPSKIYKIQPCDAGIISAYKMYYRKNFYRRILEGYEVDKLIQQISMFWVLSILQSMFG